ncbi:MAG TPA: fibronectin type III domain-containing protein [Baekduia sp.]|nr:fibronectin type III domain-containing protein [Baekduia sp.]
MRRLVIAAAAGLLIAAAVAVPVARALRADGHRPSISAPLATGVGQRSAELTAVVETAGLGGSLTVSYGRTSVLTTKVALGTIAHGTDAGRTGGVVAGLAPGTTYHYRLALTTVAGTIATPDATFTTSGAVSGASVRCHVPALKGRTLGAAQRALRRAACATGKVHRPAHADPGARMVVAAQTIPAGGVRPAGTRVGLRLRVA